MATHASSAPALQKRKLRELTDLARSGLHSHYRAKLADLKIDQTQPFFKRLSAFLPANLWPWASSYLKDTFTRKHVFLDYTRPGAGTGIYPLLDTPGATPASCADNPIRIAIAGDWGTGTDESQRVAAAMMRFHPHYTIHLGDVYYVGDSSEVEENCLGKIVRWPIGAVGSFALNGNHEMYARGYAYFDEFFKALGVRTAAGAAPDQQKASFFCLENPYWRILAVDTGYNSEGIPILEQIPLINRIPGVGSNCHLEDALLRWIRDALQPSASDLRGVVLLSHHQYYSNFDDQYTKPAKQLAEFFARPVLWFWGHEHRMSLYDKFQVDGGLTAYGRCAGHGGMPVEVDGLKRNDAPLVLYDDRVYATFGKDRVGFNGFLILTLSKRTLTADYYTLDQDPAKDPGLSPQSKPVLTEAWSVGADGQLIGPKFSNVDAKLTQVRADYVRSHS